MDLSNLLQVTADLSESALDGADNGDLLFDVEFFNFESLDDLNTLLPNTGDGAAQGGDKVNYEPPTFFPFREMPQALKPRPSNFPTLRKVASGALHAANISEASDKALLQELDRALQLFTVQQQFLIEQVQGLDEWIKRTYPNAQAHVLEGFNVSELLTLEDVNIMENIPSGLLQPEKPPSKQKQKHASLRNDLTSKSLSKISMADHHTHVSNVAHLKNLKSNELKSTGNIRSTQEPRAGSGIVKHQRKKEKHSGNVNIVEGGGSVAAAVSQPRSLVTKTQSYQQLHPSSLVTSESDHSTRVIRIKVKCHRAESILANPLFAKMPKLMSEPSNLFHDVACPSYKEEKAILICPVPKVKSKEGGSRKKVEAAQPPMIKGMWDWVRKEEYFKECTGAELDWMELQPEYISPKLVPETKKSPRSRSCSFSIKVPEGAVSVERACDSHIMTTAVAGDSEMNNNLSCKHNNNSFTDRLISALLPTKQQHSKDDIVLLNLPVDTTVQKHCELDLGALTEEQRLHAYMCMIGLLVPQFSGWQGNHNYIDELQMLTEELGRINCKNNQNILWLKDQVLKEVEKQRMQHVDKADSMAKVQRLKELIKCKKKQKDEIGEQQQNSLWSW